MTSRDVDVAELAGAHRAKLVGALQGAGLLTDSGWRAAVERVPRHVFVPGFYREDGTVDGIVRWRPVTPERDAEEWLTAAYVDETLVTQMNGVEPDWETAEMVVGGVPTSSATLPSLVVRMWEDLDCRDGDRVLEIGTGTGYSTALACERLGDGAVTSVDVDMTRIEAARRALRECDYWPHLGAIDGLYGYWPTAPFDRVVAACSVRYVPDAWIRQTVPGGRILVPLSGWLHGHARALLTVRQDGTAEGPLLPGTISFMPARVHAAPWVGNAPDWSPDRQSDQAEERATRYDAAVLVAGSGASDFHARFLAQLAAPTAQLALVQGDPPLLIDVVTGSAASIQGDRVRQWGPIRLWDRIEATWQAWDDAGRPGPERFRLTVNPSGQAISGAGLSFTLPNGR